MSTNRMNRVKRSDRNNRIAKALRTATPKESIPVNGEFVKAAALAKTFESASAAIEAAALLRTKYLAAVAKAAALEAQAKALVVPIKNYVMAAHGERSDVTSAFGFEPRKIAHVTVDTRADAVAKTLATRAARHTMGSRQRAAIHGTIVDPSLAPSLTSQPLAETSGASVPSPTSNGSH